MTITKPDGTQIDKTEMEALPPIFLTDFARTIGVNKGCRQLFQRWSEKHPEFKDSLKEAEVLEVQRYRVNGAMNLYNSSFSIFTLKNIAGWRDRQEIEHSHDLSDRLFDKYKDMGVEELQKKANELLGKKLNRS